MGETCLRDRRVLNIYQPTKINSIMEIIYRYDWHSRGFNNNDRSQHIYYLCDNMEQYEELLNESLAKRQDIVDAFMEKTGGKESKWNEQTSHEEWQYRNFHVRDEHDIKASFQFQPGMGWYGKEFTAVGFEVSDGFSWDKTYKIYIKPGTLSEIRNYKEKPNEWMLYCNS